MTVRGWSLLEADWSWCPSERGRRGRGCPGWPGTRGISGPGRVSSRVTQSGQRRRLHCDMVSWPAWPSWSPGDPAVCRGRTWSRGVSRGLSTGYYGSLPVGIILVCDGQQWGVSLAGRGPGVRLGVQHALPLDRAQRRGPERDGREGAPTGPAPPGGRGGGGRGEGEVGHWHLHRGGEALLVGGDWARGPSGGRGGGGRGSGRGEGAHSDSQGGHGVTASRPAPAGVTGLTCCTAAATAGCCLAGLLVITLNNTWS